MATAEDRLRFVDTNVLLAATDEGRGQHGQSLALLEKGLSGEKSLFISVQVLREYLVVGTRSIEANGLGLKPAQALANIREFCRCAMVLEETKAVAQRLQQLVGKHHLSGKRIHDANIVAVMQENGLSSLATDNVTDFSDFPEIRIDW